MSVVVSNITKLYADQKALNNVSFNISGAEVLGFLGPNGAGKSTMMKIITCYVPQTEGTVKVCGFDINDEAIEVRKNVGYLPEHNPLYLDMYVREYLSFIGEIHKINNPVKRVKEMIEITGLGLEQKKKIGALSKGYRQRVGLAQAMIHDPKVLILDEPTSGLDPNQLVEIRNLIKEIGKQKTVVLSTHIMQEVKAICSRVIIINKGKIVADDKAENLQQRLSGENIFIVEFDKKILADELKWIEGIQKVENQGNNKWKLYSAAENDIRPALFNYSVSKGLTILTLHKEEQNLEDIFYQLTK